MANTVTACLFFFLVSLCTCTANELSRGWGDDIEWITLEDGLVKAKDEQKPLMLLIHKSWCGACKALKPKFEAAKEITTLSSEFVMVNVQDEEEPKDSQYSPDGGYIPRVLFLDYNGNVRTEFYNEKGNEKYKFYYPVPDHSEYIMKCI
ncbi:hypothetical protein ScPMuIL_006165 [Solemya velum]